MHPLPQFVPVIEANYRGKVHIEEARRRDDGRVDAWPSGGVIKCSQKCCELLMLGKHRQHHPYAWDRCVILHLAQV